MKQIEFVVFDREQVEDLIVNLGLSVSRGYIAQDGAPVKCESCHRQVEIQHVGNIVPGSTKVYCDKSTCFAEYVDRYLWD